MSIPTKLEQALNYKWHPGNVDILHRLMIERILEIEKRASVPDAPPSHESPRVVELPTASPNVSLYDSEPDGLEA